MKVSEIMTKDVVSFSRNTTIKEAIITLAEKKITGAPVTDDENNILGIITQVDILDRIIRDCNNLRLVLPKMPESIPLLSVMFVESGETKKMMEYFKDIANKPVSTIMSSKVITVKPDTTLTETLKLYVKHDINRLPVEEHGKLVGIITRTDIIVGLAKQ